jgi:hypothetical protein
MDRSGTFRVLGTGLGQAQVTHLARGDQLGRCADGLGDRHLRAAQVAWAKDSNSVGRLSDLSVRTVIG